MIRYTPGKRYMLDGDTLNRLIERVETNKLLQGSGYNLEILPGVGTRLRGIRGGGSVSTLWDLQITDPETPSVAIVNPGQVRKTAALDGSGLVTVGNLGDSFTAAAGKILALKYEPDLTTELAMLDEWDGWPMPFDSAEDDGLWVMTAGYLPLWAFVAATDDPRAVRLGDTLYGVRLGYDAHLIFAMSWAEDKDGHVVPIYELVPATGSLVSS